jgi:L-serine dehydratase
MKIYNNNRALTLWELAVEYESMRGNITRAEVLDRMKDIVEVLLKSLKQGLEGTEYEDRILKPQSRNYISLMENNHLPGGKLFNTIIANVSSLMEVKSSMGIVVAAPTAGSCAALPGSVIAAGQLLNLSVEDMVKAMLSAGLIGVFISARSTFAAEVCGCQAECGAGSGMAAAALVTIFGGSVEQAINASSMALQNTLGMICDPVANRVEVPCLGKNILGATNALACANMSLAGFDPVIPLDEVIDTMDKVGKSIPVELRCTALGGLSVTKTSKTIEENLDKNR